MHASKLTGNRTFRRDRFDVDLLTMTFFDADMSHRWSVSMQARFAANRLKVLLFSYNFFFLLICAACVSVFSLIRCVFIT